MPVTARRHQGGLPLRWGIISKDMVEHDACSGHLVYVCPDMLRLVGRAFTKDIFFQSVSTCDPRLFRLPYLTLFKLEQRGSATTLQPAEFCVIGLALVAA